MRLCNIFLIRYIFYLQLQFDSFRVEGNTPTNYFNPNTDGWLDVSCKPALPVHSSVSDAQDDAAAFWCQLSKTIPLLQPLG